MVSGWLDYCGLRSIDLRHFGYVPHTRLRPPTNVANYALNKAQTLERFEELGYRYRFELRSGKALSEATRHFADQIMSGEITVGEWTAVVIDRRKIPNVLFAFRESADAVRAKLVLEI